MGSGRTGPLPVVPAKVGTQGIADHQNEGSFESPGPDLSKARHGWEAAIAHKASGLINRAPMAEATGMPCSRREGFLRRAGARAGREEAALGQRARR